MGRADRWRSGLQRMVTTGDVIYVHHVSRKHEPPPPALADPALADPAPADEPVPAAEPPVAGPPEPIVVHTGLDSWTYTPAPPGHAYEFGTGRIVPVSPWFGPR